METNILETARLLLRPWQETDAVALYRYASDPAVGPVAGWPPHTSVEDSLNIIRTVFAAPETYAVVLKSTGEPVGSAGIMSGTDVHSAEMQDDEAEIGYWTAVPYWGRGIMPEAVRALLKRCFTVLGVRTVWCGHYDGNGKSRRVMEKCGFTFHHTETGKTSPLGDIRTEHFFCLTKDGWETFRKLPSFRSVTALDIPELRELFRTTVLTVNAADYTAAETEDWASCGDSEAHWNGLLDTLHFLAATDEDGHITGFAAIRDDGYLHSMFVHKDHQRQGIATALLARMEEYAVAHGIREITSEVSITARPFFERHGYTVEKEQKRRAKRLKLTNFVMKKPLG